MLLDWEFLESGPLIYRFPNLTDVGLVRVFPRLATLAGIKIVCALLSLPIPPEVAKPLGEEVANTANGVLHKTLNKLLLVGCKFWAVLSVVDRLEIDKAYKLVDKIREENICPDVITYTSMIGGLGLVGQPDKSRDVLKEMREYGCYPDVAAYNAVIRNFCIAKRIGDAYSLMDEMVRKGLSPNATTYNVFLRSFFWSNDLRSSWSLYQRMKRTGCPPNTQSCLFLIRLCRRQEKVDIALELWKDMVEKGFGSYILVSDVLFDLLCDVGKLVEAEQCFLQMVEKGQRPSNVSFRRIKVLLELANKEETLRNLTQKLAAFGSSSIQVSKSDDGSIAM
ncbi:hypothetical protein Vadar_033408 [Vaccinium darrowii]|uniref:Uncharacterized protein n=1 Tax=Vaccinium darrowii TaxID=229202 RepID=A0ACB7XLL3_9ERIC|nr:hypothetical protein Vadar_033408 [Vaccinium darrowii]